MLLLVKRGFTSSHGVWCYQWSVVLQVEAVVLLVERGATNAIEIAMQ